MSAEAATRALGGKWHGRRGTAMCPVHDNRNTPALSLADGEEGKLLVYCFAGCDSADVLRELNRRGLGGADIIVHAPPKPDRRKSDRRGFALALWRESHPIQDTLAERYLRERGIKSAIPIIIAVPSVIDAHAITDAAPGNDRSRYDRRRGRPNGHP